MVFKLRHTLWGLWRKGAADRFGGKIRCPVCNVLLWLNIGPSGTRAFDDCPYYEAYLNPVEKKGEESPQTMTRES